MSVETMWLMIARRSASGRSLGGEPWKQRPWWNAAPPGGTSIGTISASTLGRPHLVHPAEPVLRRVEGVARRQLTPGVRAARVVDGAGVGGRLVERHPAGRHVGRLEERHVGGVLVRQQRLARRRLPDHVVLQQAHARLARELGGEARVALGQRDVREPAVGLPDVAQLPRAVGRRDARRVVDLVGREARLPLVLEAGVEALARALDLVVGEPVLDDQEAVALVLPGSARASGRSASCIKFYHLEVMVFK